MDEDQFADLKQFIDGRISQTEHRFDERLSQTERRLDEKLSQTEQRLNGKIQELREEMQQGFEGVGDALETTVGNLEERVTRLEQQAA